MNRYGRFIPADKALYDKDQELRSKVWEIINKCVIPFDAFFGSLGIQPDIAIVFVQRTDGRVNDPACFDHRSRDYSALLFKSCINLDDKREYISINFRSTSNKLLCSAVSKHPRSCWHCSTSPKPALLRQNGRHFPIQLCRLQEHK